MNDQRHVSFVSRFAPVVGLIATVAGMTLAFCDIATSPVATPFVTILPASLSYTGAALLVGFVVMLLVGAFLR